MMGLRDNSAATGRRRGDDWNVAETVTSRCVRD